jgi:hypothetical protein
MWQQFDLDAVSRRSSQQLLDLFLRGRGGSRSAWRDRDADLEEHLFKSGWGTKISVLAGLPLSFLNECGVPNRHVREHAGAGDEPLVAKEEGDLAFEDVEAFFLPAVDVWGWAAARRDNRLRGLIL